ncbi:NB-ARC domain-containing protein, partial [Myxosarcina sp. GI1]|uniref:NB-ARC domain-containing protein n=1 Tax=Myxosarcina sp. GI1 TaxID=1541065 RepID=UPI00155A99CF
MDEETFSLDIKFTERDNEKKKLQEWLINQHNNQKIVIISGTSGVGKSTLACNFALQNKKKFPDGIYGVRVNEERFAESEDFLGEIAKEFLTELGIKLNKNTNNKQIIKKMKECFANLKALLIFDNVETERVIKLFPGGKCAIIVTTTKKSLLHQLTDNQKIELFLPNEVDSSDLRENLINFSLNLLKNHVGENRKNEIEQKPLIAKKILDLIGYLPLAITLISNTLEVDFQEYDLDEFWESLKDEKSRIQHLYKEINVKGLDAWYAFALAIKGLEQKAKKIFVCFGACAKTGFSLELISRTAEFNSPESAKTCLRKNLVSNYLIKESNGYFIPRHNLIHDFAKFLLEEEILYEWLDISNSLNVNNVHIKNNHASYFVDLVNQDYFFPFNELDKKIKDKYNLKDLSNKNKINYKDIIDKLNFDYDNLTIAATWLAKTENFGEDSYRFILSIILGHFFYEQRNSQEFVKLVDNFYETAPKRIKIKEYDLNFIRLK